MVAGVWTGIGFSNLQKFPDLGPASKILEQEQSPNLKKGLRPLLLSGQEGRIKFSGVALNIKYGVSSATVNEFCDCSDDVEIDVTKKSQPSASSDVNSATNSGKQGEPTYSGVSPKPKRRTSFRQKLKKMHKKKDGKSPEEARRKRAMVIAVFDCESWMIPTQTTKAERWSGRCQRRTSCRAAKTTPPPPLSPHPTNRWLRKRSRARNVSKFRALLRLASIGQEPEWPTLHVQLADRKISDNVPIK